MVVVVVLADSCGSGGCVGSWDDSTSSSGYDNGIEMVRGK